MPKCISNQRLQELIDETAYQGGDVHAGLSELRRLRAWMAAESDRRRAAVEGMPSTPEPAGVTP